MSGKWTPYLLIGGGLTAVGTAIFAAHKSAKTADAIKEAVEQPPPAPGAPPAPLPTFNARTTGYWPFTARDDEKKMEGGTKDRLGNPLHTVEDFLAGKAPYVSVAGDYGIFPYGQRLALDAWPGVIFRVVDTGGHFHGSGKLYRIVGYEPLDICVQSSKTKVPTTAVATIYPGDHMAKKGITEVATSKFKDQTVAGDIYEGRTSEDHEALARAIESELGGYSRDEQVHAAWVIRNRADASGKSIRDILTPSGEYGSPQKSGGYASTRRAPTDRARLVVSDVLGALPQEDPTGGAVDFWIPQIQTRMHQLGDVHRAAKSSGDDKKAALYSRYANYGSEGETRTKFARQGLKPVMVIGSIELLRRD